MLHRFELGYIFTKIFSPCDKYYLTYWGVYQITVTRFPYRNLQSSMGRFWWFRVLRTRSVHSYTTRYSSSLFRRMLLDVSCRHIPWFPLSNTLILVYSIFNMQSWWLGILLERNVLLLCSKRMHVLKYFYDQLKNRNIDILIIIKLLSTTLA